MSIALLPATNATVIHNMPKRRPNFITINHYSRRNESLACENPILLFMLKTRLVFVSLLNYDRRGMSFSLSSSCQVFYDFLYFLLALDMTSPLPLFNSELLT